MRVEVVSHQLNRLSLDEGHRKEISDDEKPNAAPGDSAPNPKIVSVGDDVRTQDITEAFRRASKALPTGDVVRLPDFPLFEAVGALEIGDPKMDNGIMGGAGGESLDEEYNVTKKLTAEQTLGVMNQLLCFEVAWHQGFSPTQTIFASHYIDHLLQLRPAHVDDAVFHNRPEKPKDNELVNLVLRAFCLGMIKTCDFVHRRITSEKFYEEEDFVSHLCGCDLLPDIDEDAILVLIREAMAYITDQDVLEVPTGLRAALAARMEFRYLLLPAVNPQRVLDYKNTNYLIGVQKALEIMIASNEFAEYVPAAFSQQLQRKLASTTPPRPLIVISIHEALQFMRDLILQFIAAYDTSSAFTGTRSLMISMRFRNCRSPQPPIFVRCLTQSLFWNNNRVLGIYDVQDVLRQDIGEYTFYDSNILDSANDQVEAPQDPRFKIAQVMSDFYRKVFDPYLDLFVAHCMNRSRLRRVLCHSIQEWQAIQAEAHQVDTELLPWHDVDMGTPDDHTLPALGILGIWSLRHKFCQILLIIQLGFELDLYQSEEMAAMYCLLNYYSDHAQGLIIGFQELVVARIREHSARQSWRLEGLRKSYFQLQHDCVDNATTTWLSRALSQLYAFLHLLGFVRGPFETTAYSSSKARYLLRMKPFRGIRNPPCPTFEKFLDLVTIRPARGDDARTHQVLEADPKTQALGILSNVTEAAGKVKEALPSFSKSDHITDVAHKLDIKKTLKTAIAISVIAADCTKALRKYGNSVVLRDIFEVEIPKSEDAHHEWWIIPKIKVKEIFR